MKVVQKAISIMHPDLEKRMKHITHGMMKLSTGKMSSRKGNVITGESLLRDSMDIVLEKMKERDLSEEEKKKISEIVGVSALKYSILRSSLGSDIIYDFEKSISFDGDSGPYLQYTSVRANSILKKAENVDTNGRNDTPENVTDLEKIIYKFPEVIEYSYSELQPHHIATYLIELASAFNTFYGNTQILVEENKYMAYHLNLIKAFNQTMKNGLWLLGIEVPERM
jgi:arginyl-tRNA synthetase